MERTKRMGLIADVALRLMEQDKTRNLLGGVRESARLYVNDAAAMVDAVEAAVVEMSTTKGGA